MDVNFNKGKFTGQIPRESDSLFMVHLSWFCIPEMDKNISRPGREALAADLKRPPAQLLPTNVWKNCLQAAFFAWLHGIAPSGLFPPA